MSSDSMVQIIVEDIVPILVIMALGYVLGKRGYFDSDQRQGLNKVVLDIALPAALFVSIVKATRADLFSDVTLTLVSLVGIVGMFLLSFWLCKKLFHHNTQEAGVCALIAGSPTIGFLGFAVLDPIYGDTVTTNLVIAIVAIIVNAITIPIGFYLINIGQDKAKKLASEAAKKTVAAQASGSAGAMAAATPAVATDPDAGKKVEAPIDDKEAKGEKAGKEIAVSSVHGKRHHDKIKNPNLAAVVNALEQPVCWAPILAVVFVLIGIRVPEQLDPTFELIAKANSGVAVLAAGLALSTVKFSLGKETLWNTFFRLVLTPAVIVALAILCGMGHDASKLAMLCMAVALPPAFSGIIISSRYNIYVREGASSVAVSTVGFAATCILWVWLMPIITSAF
ncbi:AEC family transporter [Olsenella sp. YH-ols2217]|uniref:AEC family transporter n=1 Tax=Kribbibacterium absianum TaxID=3044210 RepID=A0ABT6ZN84_9ACTN|nr:MULTISPECIES: AEC family transporter [unclassified Olsenella]MDJ1122254.1 AEC family transporter [Olsenella sp. YH-ols2216]MDJ1130332.1 AEC family transporter [Olsenella sp. YH-ols2217]